MSDKNFPRYDRRSCLKICAAIVTSSWLLNSNVLLADQLFWHTIRLDNQGKLLSWADTDSSYDQIIRADWTMFENIPMQSNGYRTYFTYPKFNGMLDPSKPFFEGLSWAHNPAGLFAMLTDSAILYHTYSGDDPVMERVREMLDHFIADGTTAATDSWALVPYSSSDAGNPIYCGGTDTIYCYQEGNTPCGRADGVGYLEPDKVGELGFAYLQFYEFTLAKKYLRAALHCANALASHVREGDEQHSPWPFRVDAATGAKIREEYTANTIGPIKLFDELLRLKLGNQKTYARARTIAWNWMMKYPVENQVWSQYFEDVLIYPDYRTNRNQYSPLETARYLLEHPGMDSQAAAHAEKILDWVAGFFAKDSTTMAGLPEKGLQWGAEVLSEQVNDMDKMASHTARFASVCALYYEVTGDASYKERAFRSFNWATYASRQDGLVLASLDQPTGYWFSDGYGDYMRHFQRGMASVPEWAPAKESHLLGSTSVVRSIHYGAGRIDYQTFDDQSREVLRLREAPQTIRAGWKRLPRLENFQGHNQGYTVEAIAGGGFVVHIQHEHSGDIQIRLEKTAP